MAAAVSTSTAESSATAIDAGDGDDVVVNTGTLESEATSLAVAINGGLVDKGVAIAANNSWDGGVKAEARARGVDGSAGSDALTNAGDITVLAKATAPSVSGAIAVTGLPVAISTATATSDAAAIDAGDGTESDEVLNLAGTKLTASAEALAATATVSVTNAGAAFAADAVWDGGTKAEATARGIATGLGADVLRNAGEVEAISEADSGSAAVAVAVSGLAGAAAASTSTAGSTALDTGDGEDLVENDGKLTSTSTAKSLSASVGFTNSGVALALNPVWDGGTQSHATATGIATGGGADVVDNTAEIAATSDADTAAGSFSVAVTGVAGATATSTGVSTATAIDTGDGVAADQVTNSGTLKADAGSIALSTSVGVTTAGVAVGGDFFEKQKVAYVLFWFTDLEGHLKSFAITPGEVEAALDDGMGFDGSSITGFNAIEESDMVAIPDPTTFRIMPRRPEGSIHPQSGVPFPPEALVGRMICDIVKPDGTPYEGDPRYMLRKALERMQDMGFDTFNIGPELEYFLFEDNKGTVALDEGGYFAMTALDAATELRNETIQALEAMGIPIEYHHHEVAPSQHEIDMRYSPALEMADATITYRLIVKEIAAKNGVYATFMPKPLAAERLGHAHAHVALHGRPQSVLRRRRPASPLADREGLHRRPAPARARAVGGLRTVGELVQAARAGLRGAGVRRRGRSGTAPRWSESRYTSRGRAGDARRDPLPDPACNPYLTFAALLHAGLEGIEHGYELEEPMDSNLYHLSAAQRHERGIVALPGTLGEAVEELAGSELMKKALGDHIHERYVEIKRKEWDDYRIQLTQWELDRYLAVL